MEEEADLDAARRNSDTWFPYPSKVYFLLDIIDTLPRLRISGSIMKTIIWLLRECGVENIPSYKKFRDMQENLRKDAGISTIQWKSPQGNTFSFNDPIALVANDWTNPLVAPHLRIYPSIPKDGLVSKVWHASKWRRDVDHRFLSPMYANRDQHFYINELARLTSGQFVIPIQWLMNKKDNSVYADMWIVYIDENSLATIDDTDTFLIPARELEFNMLELLDKNEILSWSPQNIVAGHPQQMPNPDRALADDDELYTSFIDVFGNVISGNQSNSWNKHWNVYITHQILPRKMLQQQYNVHFVSTLQHASVSEQFHGIYERISPDRNIRIRLRCFCGPGDNPLQSEITGHIGGNGNYPCRKCHIGGTQKDKETSDGFQKFFEPGMTHSSNENIACLEAQLSVASLGKAQHVKEMQSASGVKDSFTQYWIDDFLCHSCNFRREYPGTASEHFQAILRGWISANSALVYNPYLRAPDNEGVCWPPYIVQYANSLVGRQLKVLAQVSTFHIYNLVSTDVFALTRAVAELTALLWFPEIQNMDVYLKIKYHHLMHIEEDIRWFGPLIGVMTENYKSYNSVFRACSVLSNHLSPSRDIAHQLSRQETANTCKHILSGGLWFSRSSNDWVKPGFGVQRLIETNPYLRSVHGWLGNTILDPKVKTNTGKWEYRALRWAETSGVKAENPNREWESFMWYSCKKLISQYSNACEVRSWVFATSPFIEAEAKETLTGRILSILRCVDNPSQCIVLLDVFETVSTCHPIFNMPVLRRCFGEARIVAVSGNVILFDYNVQHDCHAARCSSNPQELNQQEHAHTGATQAAIVHRALDQYIFNTQSLHNPHLICQTVSCQLIAPVLKHVNCASLHHKQAGNLRAAHLITGLATSSYNPYSSLSRVYRSL
ncbi:hypothetical protein AGABI2DRAFT_149834 [Agaricus bisporus var. bisporus H97]|uniref:hypothetical protein n=1 Tax=Agaricus bisporus var. bisporus (strain H97 / ATCC MYA-4626 / FGSC 10389) TaxID=936046 RepID=UPI00029F7876|nr:hypothetical protein AGABI2DRAFT_149834 [Agaricus bisporus var. bisporus H97]EKV47995.1 hypothetical protein AGABI2DRAFT_149834 [Agaricus bisporus var. bisporus H97]